MVKFITKACVINVGLKNKEKMVKIKCNICPRNCNTIREKQAGFCGMKNLKVAKIMRHFWEEPPISGTKGSGAIFFSGCSLKCCYCQNFEISHNKKGKTISILELADIFKKIEISGCENINLVSPTHFTNEIIEALKIYKPKIPIIWNTSGYEKTSTIKKLKKFIDVFLVDYKYSNSQIAKNYSFAENYPLICQKAIKQMRKNQPKDVIQNGLMKKGIIVRHLILPNNSQNSLDCINWIYKKLGNTCFLSIMSQYTPCFNATKFTDLSRKIKPIEQKIVLSKIKKLNFKNCFYQDIESATTDFIPDFSKFWEL